MRKIRNRDQLLQKGDHEAREKVVSMLEGVLQAMDARVRIRALMRLEGDLLTVGNKSWDLSQKKNCRTSGSLRQNRSLRGRAPPAQRPERCGRGSHAGDD